MGYSFRLAASHRQDSTNQLWSSSWNEIQLNGFTIMDRSDDPSHHEQTLYHGSKSHSSIYKALGQGRKEGNVLFNDALNTFYLRLYGVTHMVKDHSDSERERGNPQPPHGLLLSIRSKGSFICITPQTG